MAEEEKEAKKNTDLIYVAVFVIFSILVLGFFQQALIWWFAGAILGGLIAALSKQPDIRTIFLRATAFALIFGIVSLFSMPVYAEINNLQKQMNLPTVPQMFQEVRKPFVCLFDYAGCQKQYSESYSYDSSKVQSGSKSYIKVNFPYNFERENQPIEISGELTVMNQLFDNMHIDARCSINNVTINANPSSFDFSKSSAEQYNALTCSSPEYIKGDLSLKLSSKYKSETVLPITIGQKGNIGKQISEMKYDSPYKLSISLSYSQPLRNGDYIMYVVLEKQQTSTLTSIESLKVSTISEKAKISCDKMSNLGVFSMDRETLKEFLINPSKDTFLWQCRLDIENAPESSEEAYIGAEAIYTAESEYKTSLQVVK